MSPPVRKCFQTFRVRIFIFYVMKRIHLNHCRDTLEAFRRIHEKVSALKLFQHP
jgi:hypothetical protein